MARRQLLTDEERRTLLGLPLDPDGMARVFTLSRSDRELVAKRRGGANQLGVAVQLALLRHPGTTLANLGEPPGPLVSWMAAQIDIRESAFAEYARRPQPIVIGEVIGHRWFREISHQSCLASVGPSSQRELPSDLSNPAQKQFTPAACR